MAPDRDVHGALHDLIAAARIETIKECAAVIGNMRQSEAGLIDAKHSGQRGCDRSDALHDAYQAVMSLAKDGQQ